MEYTSNRWQQWMKPSENEMAQVLKERYAAQKAEVAEPRPQFILWIEGGRTLYDGEMIGLADLNFYYGEDATNSFSITVDSPLEAVTLIRHITHSLTLGLVELDEDGDYCEWYSEIGDDIETVADRIHPKS